MDKDDTVYLKHILESICKIEEYCRDREYAHFLRETILHDAVIRQIEIIGEATKNISDGLKIKYEQIPWKDIAGMRDRLIRSYFGVDLESVWITVKKDLPLLKKQITEIMKKLG